MRIIHHHNFGILAASYIRFQDQKVAFVWSSSRPKEAPLNVIFRRWHHHLFVEAFNGERMLEETITLNKYVF